MFSYTISQKIILPIALVVMIALAILFHFVFKNKSEKVKNIPFFIIGIFLLCLEIGKQIYYIFFVEYITYALPFHFCTLTIFVIILSHLTNSKFSKFLRPIAFAFSGLIVALLYIYPTATIGSSTDNIFLNYYTFHTFTFHHLVVFYFILTIAMQTYKPKLTDCYRIIGGIVFYGLYAVPIAYSLNTNYVNILSSPIKFLDEFRIANGQFLYDTVWFVFCAVCACSICIVYYFITKLINKKKKTC